MPSRRCVCCRPSDVEDQRQTGPIWLAAEELRPDAGVRAQISADTAIDDQSAATSWQCASRLPGVSPLSNARVSGYRDCVKVN